MTDKEVEEVKSKVEELVFWLKTTEDKNLRLKKELDTCKKKLDLLMKELEEENGKRITFSNGTITIKTDIREAFNENKALKDENTALKQQIKDMKDALHVMIDALMDKIQ